jgi:hypothetical protein
MTILTALLFGALLGALLARRRGGHLFDYAQYMAVFAMIFALLALFVSLFALNSAG